MFHGPFSRSVKISPVFRHLLLPQRSHRTSTASGTRCALFSQLRIRRVCAGQMRPTTRLPAKSCGAASRCTCTCACAQRWPSDRLLGARRAWANSDQDHWEVGTAPKPVGLGHKTNPMCDWEVGGIRAPREHGIMLDAAAHRLDPAYTTQWSITGKH